MILWQPFSFRHMGDRPRLPILPLCLLLIGASLYQHVCDLRDQRASAAHPPAQSIIARVADGGTR